MRLVLLQVVLHVYVYELLASSILVAILFPSAIVRVIISYTASGPLLGVTGHSVGWIPSAG